MSQFDPVIGADKSGLAYRQDDNNGKKALLTHHKNPTAPSYAEAGMIWLDDSATPWLFKSFDGTDWITIGSLDAAGNTYTPYVTGAALGVASETIAGLVERATDAEATAGTDTTRYISPKQLKDNIATQDQRAKAWVKFDGTGILTILDSYNVSSVTDHAAGDYTINFTNAFATANYTAATASHHAAGNNPVVIGANSNRSLSASTYPLAVAQGTVRLDLSHLSVLFFGDLA